MVEDFKLKNINILITGGAGFIGSNLCEYLLNLEANITCLDNLSTGYKKNIKQFLNNRRFQFVKGDIKNLETCQKACKNQQFVLHHAALGSVPRSIKDPISTNEVNISGFLNMLIACRDQKVSRFIFAASSSTYGDSKDLPKIENEIGNPLSPYAITKYVNELYADIFHKNFGLNYIGLRYFNVFGKRQDPDGAYAAVIPLFIKNLLNHDSPTINGDGTYSRDFTYINNVIQMNVLAITSNNKKSINQIYNTACGDRTSLNELVYLLKKYLSKFDKKIKDIEVKYGPVRDGDIPHSLASIEKAKELLKYSPNHNIENGLEDSIKWYYNNL